MAKPEPDAKQGTNKALRSPEFEANKWKPGQSGNPKGRPKGKTLEQVVRDVLSEAVAGTEGDKMDALARVFVSEALVKRKSAAMSELISRLWPKPNAITIAGDKEHPIQADVALEVSFSNLSKEQQQAAQDLAHAAMNAGGDS